jgi:hypothetical protein
MDVTTGMADSSSLPALSTRSGHPPKDVQHSAGDVEHFGNRTSLFNSFRREEKEPAPTWGPVLVFDLSEPD